jgi:RNA-directed DNA polymerase
VARRLETRVEEIFHPDSYGYRPGRAAQDAVEVCRRRCWSTDWVIDLDIQKFFDSVPRDLIIRAVEANTDLPWVVLYVKRWLDAPVQNPDGSVLRRDRGTPQGSAVSPVLAGLPRVFRTGFLLVLGYFLAVQPSVVNFLRCAVSEP